MNKINQSFGWKFWRMNLRNYGTEQPFDIKVSKKYQDIEVVHFSKTNVPGFKIRGHCGDGILLILIQRGLLEDINDIEYLQSELEKADMALQSGTKYIQDK